MLALALSVVSALLPLAGPQQDPATRLLEVLQRSGRAGDAAAIRALAPAGVSLDELVEGLTQAADRLVVQERDRMPLDGERLRLLVEVFLERGVQGRLVTWSMDIAPGPTEEDLPSITNAARLSAIPGLYRLSLDTTREFSVHDLTIRAPDLVLEMSSGSAFLSETPSGPTAVVLLGRGRMRFTPQDPAERTQVRIFSGDEELSTTFDSVFLRVRPSQFNRFFPEGSLRPKNAVNAQTARRAEDVFDENVGRTLQIDLSDLSRDRWSLVPQGRDVIAEVRTQRYGTLTYTRTFGDAEDVALFDRRRRRNIALYASPEKMKERGRFYSEDDLVDYDVLQYDVNVSMSPDRSWIEGVSRLRVKIRGETVNTLSLRLAETLQVRNVSSQEFGRLLHFRVVGQSVLIVNLPGTIVEGSEFWVSIAYAGRLEAQTLDRAEMIQFGQFGQELRDTIPMEPHWLYSNRSYWYPQSLVTDYAPATIRIALPSGMDAVATGRALPPADAPEDNPALRGRKVFTFVAEEPVRYLACVISRFNTLDPREVPVGEEGGETLSLLVQVNPRQSGRGRSMIGDAADITSFYASLVGGAPYPNLTLAVTENNKPGGHSPPYFALINQIVPSAELIWRNDPVSFDSFPLFFVAHEIAHQWWGHGVGWKNYHEQWISEGFAQYFAALYAQRQRGDGAFGSVLRQMRATAIDNSSQGPIYLGYRLGHIRNDDRVFRALVYNKGAMVLHMLRRRVGDEAFFSGLRTFYERWKFKKAGTDDFRQVMEEASQMDLAPFFEAWVYGAAIPQVSFKSDVRDNQLSLRFEADAPVIAPITVTITYSSGRTEDVLVQMADKVATVTAPVTEPVRSITANADHAALVEVRR